MTKFIAFAVDISGAALARYDLAATEKEAAEQEARRYLEQHHVIEVWSDDHRRVANRKQVGRALGALIPSLCALRIGVERDVKSEEAPK